MDYKANLTAAATTRILQAVVGAKLGRNVAKENDTNRALLIKMHEQEQLREAECDHLMKKSQDWVWERKKKQKNNRMNLKLVLTRG